MLNVLAADGARLGIATGHVTAAIEPALEKFGWRKYFCNVQAADKAPSKPHPGMLLQALSETNTRADDAIMIGDTAFDMLMAGAAGLKSVGVGWGYHGVDRLGAAGASCIVNDMDELHDLLMSFR